ncbi:MAG: hypothetical protein Q4P06_04600 [Actinomycetaceae bacterium]|nr:hypothetical protein [Actinomycetaceae bacterium]
MNPRTSAPRPRAVAALYAKGPYALLTTLLTSLLLLVSPAAWAADPLQVADHLEDRVELFSSDFESQMRTELNDTTASGVNLYVVLVDTFTGADSADHWCVRTGEASKLASNAVIYALATKERSYAICGGPDIPFTQTQLSAGAGAAVKELQGKNVDAPTVLAAVQTLTTQLRKDIGVAATPAPSSAASSATTGSGAEANSEGSSISWLFLAFVGSIALIGVITYFQSRRKGKTLPVKLAAKSGPGGKETTDADSLRNQAAVMLMRTENIVHNAGDDLAFARAQFGNISTEKFAAAYKQADALVSQAFELQRQQEEANSTASLILSTQIMAKCQSAQELLAKYSEEFTKLRNIEANAPAAIADLRERIGEARGRVERTHAEIEALKLQFSPATLRTVLQSPATASQLLDAAEESLEAAQKRLGDDRAEAVHRIEIAQRAFGQAMVHIEAVMNASTDLAKSDERLVAAIASISSDIADVDRLATRDQVFGPLVQDAEAAIEAAHAARRKEGDPLQALTKLQQAEEALDLALASLREQDENRTRNEQRLRTEFELTDDALRRAQSFLSTHRGVASQTARQFFRRAEEQRQDAYEKHHSSPEEALELLRVAKANAEKAIDLVGADLQQAHSNRPTASGGTVGGIDPWSLVLGGILLGDNRSGGRTSPGWGAGSGSGWNTGGFGGGFGGGFSGGVGGGWSSGGSGKF